MSRSRDDAVDKPGVAGNRVIDGGLAVEAGPGLPDIRRFSHEAMATVFEVYAEHPDAPYAAQAAAAAFDLADRLELDLSRFLPNSDISRINRLAAGDLTRISPSTLECLVIARHLFDVTGGAFDISIGTGLPSLEVDPEHFTVRATGDGVTVDLGGIGKGYAVDRMADLLEEWELGRALVHGGFSSMLALDAPAGRDGWPLTLSDPETPTRVLASLCVRQTALGASGLRKGAHIVDPRTGEPARGRRATWVVVPRPEAAESDAPDASGPRTATAAVTDALTTAFMLMSAGEIEALCDASPGLQAWILAGTAGPTETALQHFGAPCPDAPGAPPIRAIL